VRHHRHYPVRKLLAEGSLAALRSRYSENDLEEIFVKVVAPHYAGKRPTDMNLRNIGIVYRKELREALRDRRTLISSLLVPLLLFPLLTAGIGAAFSALIGKAKEEVPAVMILGGDDSPGILAELRGSGKIKIVPTTRIGGCGH